MRTSLITPLLLALAGAMHAPADAADTADQRSVAQAARGKYLVDTSGCMDCHTPFKMGPNGPEPDMSRMLSGHPEQLVMPPAPALPAGPWLIVSSGTNTAHAGPWGVSFTANLTPDPETGLGLWSARDFRATIRTGRHLGRGRAVLPPMPIPVYNHFSDDDLDAVFAYLRTIPPIRNRVPEPLPPAQRSAARP
ncbi:c-type cytochrome [Aquincola sp. S2]|uniref:C-type cytochrome n=1 Tax=Pseudaquabacterium terrae TaxID=2732868 RepID=A0ABX2EAR0_9BURK|nr:c-type cytochrome [Aquabacterium terrae]NRF65591.1 c-type cytochrome [Aquabacterium terrae]